MRSEPLHPRVEVELRQAVIPAVVDEPIEQQATVSLGTMRLVRHQVVNVSESAPGKTVGDSKTGYCRRLAIDEHCQ